MKVPNKTSWPLSFEVHHTLVAFWRRVPAPKLVVLLLLMVGVGLTEGFGVMLLVPLLGAFSGTEQTPEWMSFILVPFQWVGLQGNAAVVLAVFVVLVGLRTAVQFGRDALAAVLQAEVVDALREDCFAALLRVEWRWLSGRRQADHVSLLLTDLNRVGVGLHFAIGWLASLATGLAWTLAAFWLSFPMTLLAMAGAR
jgi:ATP-binding cassette subfamily C protein